MHECLPEHSDESWHHHCTYLCTEIRIGVTRISEDPSESALHEKLVLNVSVHLFAFQASPDLFARAAFSKEKLVGFLATVFQVFHLSEQTTTRYIRMCMTEP